MLTTTPTATNTPTLTTTPTATATSTATPTQTPTSTPTTNSGDGATVSGTLYNDANQNGNQDGDEAGIPDAEVELRDNNRSGEATRTAITDANGVYTFPNVPVGQYTLQVVQLPPGQGAVNLPPLTVDVTGTGAVEVPPAPLVVRRLIYLPTLHR